MNSLPQTGEVITAAGRGRFERQADGREVLITLTDGRQFTAPAELVSEQADGQYVLSLALSDVRHRLGPDTLHTGSGAAGPETVSEELVIPVVEEAVAIGTREVERGRVRITKTVRELEDEVETRLQRDEVDVERVPVNEYVDAASPVEYADDRVIIPIYEEVVVVEKRLLLKEKLVITRRQVETREVQPVTRRVEEAVVERMAAGNASEPGT